MNKVVDLFPEDSIDFNEDWLSIEDYQLKILLLTSVLADNSLAYRGTLKTMCEWLGVSSNSKNNRKIKTALMKLEEQGLIFYKVEGRTYHVSISNKGLKEKSIVKVRKVWIQEFKNYNKDSNNKRIDKSISIDWIKILKVFVYLYNNPFGDICTMKEIANSLQFSEETAMIAVNAIANSQLNGLLVYKNIIRETYNDSIGNKKYKTIGTDISIGFDFDTI